MTLLMNRLLVLSLVVAAPAMLMAGGESDAESSGTGAAAMAARPCRRRRTPALTRTSVPAVCMCRLHRPPATRRAFYKWADPAHENHPNWGDPGSELCQ